MQYVVRQGILADVRHELPLVEQVVLQLGGSVLIEHVF